MIPRNLIRIWAQLLLHLTRKASVSDSSSWTSIAVSSIGSGK
jgi:hypothetical protein